MNDRSKVVVGLDGSDGSTAALAWACDYAAAVGADVTAVQVWGYPSPGHRTGISEPYDDMKLEAMQRMRDQIEQFIAAKEPSVLIHSHVVEGPVDDVLVDESHRADLLVVGNRGLHGVRALGSVSERVAHKAPCSVLVVRRPAP